MRFQTKRDIQALLAEAGINPRRRWGQHFLIDGNLLRRLLDAAELQPDDAVLEVGPGTGALTEHLVRSVAEVIAVEIDGALAAVVADRLIGASNLTLIHADVLASKHRLSGQVTDALEAVARRTTGGLHLVANLPYSIATPLLVELLLMPRPFKRFCFTVQREVADRLAARPRTKDYGPVSVLMQATCAPSRLAILKPTVFWPSPAVESAMMRMDVLRNPFDTIERLGRFADLVRAAFGSRRKTLRFNLARMLGDEGCRALGGLVDLTRRAEELTVREWIDLASVLIDTEPAPPGAPDAAGQ